ncbi:MAG: hypothetical protein HKN25_11740 [Pyrinomonadaceae bacterium]|nr:hypothetical protein [Pyrinomonadaceae bacterium]
MKMKTLLLFLVLSTFNLAFANCIENPFAKSELSKEMPENTSFRFNRSGGMAPAWYRIEVNGSVISVEDKDMQDDKAVMWYAEITGEDKAAVYAVFFQNKFDTIKNEKQTETVYDAGSASVYLRAGKIAKGISYGMNSPLSRRNTARWQAAANAIMNLAKKYESKAVKIPENYATISYNRQAHKYIFKNLTYRKLKLPDLTRAQMLVEKSVADYNEKQIQGETIKNLEKYRFQLVSAANPANETVVWVNALCTANGSWRRQIITVDDGGSCYFNLYINLSKETYDRFSVNGNG